LFCLAIMFCALCNEPWTAFQAVPFGTDSTVAVAADPAQTSRHPPPQVQGRRSMLLLSSAAGAGTATLAAPKEASAFSRGTGQDVIRVPANPKIGTRPYIYEKPAGFKQFASPVDPTSSIFRNVNDSYFSFITRAELKPNASTEFTPEAFIADYESKFTNSTGSSFTLLQGGGPPKSVDKDLGVKYYEIEYVVRTQLGFAFDSLRSLHFLTVFAAAPESIYILNCQAQDDTWDVALPTLRKVADSFAITGDVPAASDNGWFGR